ncbi:orotate phosphoribosyltransferase [Candidatus Micrarchaeota archaeon]|nr:orotate phosphoribosyltransferase [Candidatus Micrarchaeota archaeon]
MNTSFIEFLARNNAIRFGEFTLKSGRQSPYFIDMGILSTGATVNELGKHYATKITEKFADRYDIVFGPAYKAIPLAISATIALNNSGINKRWLYDRKEVKLHGADANTMFVGGYGIDSGAKVVILDDVMTTGQTKVEAISRLEKSLKAEVVGIVIAVDRMEIGRRNSALEEFTEDTGVPVHAIVTIDDIFKHLKATPVDGKAYVSERTYKAYQEYMLKNGVKKW